MTEIVNLRTARKAKVRAEATAKAQTNRARHGRSKAEKVRDEAERAKIGRALDGAKLD